MLALAHDLWSDDGVGELRVFDDRAAYEAMEREAREGREDPSYPDSLIDRHLLVGAFGKVKGFTDDFRWLGEGRDH